MQINDFVELAKTRRSCRVFKPGPPIPDEDIDKILEAARWAMSGANGQPWEFIVVKDPKTIRKVSDIVLEKHLKEAYVIEQCLKEELRQQIFARPPEKTGWEDAAALIIVCGDRRTLQATVLSTHFMEGEGQAGSVYLKNIANATQILHLAIAAAGLASRWVSVNRGCEEALKRLLDVPDLIDVHTVVPVGYSAYKLPPSYRRELKEIVHHEKYDRSRYRNSQDIVDFIADLRKRTKPSYWQLFGKK